MGGANLGHRPSLTYLSRSQAERIHAASLEILERVGALIDEEEAAALLRKAGVRQGQEGTFHIPPKLVEWAVSAAPKRIVLHDRNGKPAMTLVPGRVYYGLGSDCLFLLDHRTGERRQATLQDVDEAIRLADALPNIHFIMSAVLPSDVPPEAANRLQMRSMIENSSKPIMFVTNDFESCLDVVKAAEVVAGGAKNHKQKPYSCCYINVTAPLRHNVDSLQKVLFLAEKGLPTTYTPMVLRGVSGPVTSAGAVALANAGELVGLVLAQLKREGAPVIHSGGYGDVFDMRTTTGAYTGPESYGVRTAMGSFYGLPVFGLGGSTDSKLPDEQAAAEASLTLLFETLGEANLIHDVGYMESGKCYSLEMMAICDEVIGHINRYCRGIEVNDETLALDLIAELGPEGDYLSTEHTVTHYKDTWYPRLFNRNHFDGWLAEDGLTLRQRTQKRVEEILNDHSPEPLPGRIKEEVEMILG
ncbi:MAG: trimethylamine methyltransferase family protein [Spirochaetaceae bacterium]|nr:MAG: trimethylamine methyltransferase family protein [Spirochaetaceae bacterium]